jgi:hypothetical protein
VESLGDWQNSALVDDQLIVNGVPETTSLEVAVIVATGVGAGSTVTVVVAVTDSDGVPTVTHVNSGLKTPAVEGFRT